MDTDDSRVHFTSTEKGEVAGGDTSHIGGENEGCMRGQLHPPREGDKKIKRTNNPGNMLFSPSVTFPTYLFCLEKRQTTFLPEQQYCCFIIFSLQKRKQMRESPLESTPTRLWETSRASTNSSAISTVWAPLETFLFAH